jgi:hypothetical protein
MDLDLDSPEIQEMLRTGAVPSCLTVQDLIEMTRDSEPERPTRYRTRVRTLYHVKKGNMRRSAYCEQCGATEPLHKHHLDYKDAFSIRWLCQPCHINEHHGLKA